LRGDSLSEADVERAARPTHHVALAVGGVFMLAELGDKTMLATITLATREGLFGTWLGSTLGMVTADALAIALGRALGTRLPERAVRVGAALAFFVFAAWLFVEAARG
jgi:putative Ca2+/H+ antiporter (TMEM165/GDT1 family)